MLLVGIRDATWKSARKNFFLKSLLLPFSFIYGLVLILREKLYTAGILKSEIAPIHTICLGNVTVGGTGKTPLTIYLAKHFSASYSVAVISRGYKSEVRTETHLVKNDDTAELIGDEAKLYRSMLPETVKIIISPKRIKGMGILKELNTTLCIMDDGLQHLSIKPQIKLCLIDISDLREYKDTGFHSIIPSGIFREPPLRGIKRADRIVFTSKGKLKPEDYNEIEKQAQALGIVKYSFLEISPSHVIDAYSGKQYAPQKDLKYSLITSIAKPESLLSSIQSLGYEIDNSLIKNDHHHFSKKEWEIFKSQSRNPAICSTKDWVKLKPYLTKENELLVVQQEIKDCSKEGEGLIEWLSLQDIKKKASVVLKPKKT